MATAVRGHIPCFFIETEIILLKGGNFLPQGFHRAIHLRQFFFQFCILFLESISLGLDHRQDTRAAPNRLPCTQGVHCIR